MRLGKASHKLRALFFLCAGWILLVSTPSRAEINRLQYQQKVAPPNLTPPDPSFEQDDAFYQKYFSSTDTKIANLYRDQWQYHDERMEWEGPNWHGEHYTLGALDYAQSPRESDVRHNFAQQVLRMRMDTGIRTYLESFHVKSINRIQHTLNSIKNVSGAVAVSRSNPDAGKIQFGYDVLTDNTHIEYVHGPFEATLFHPALVGALTGSKPKLDLATLNLSSNLGSELPKASISYPLSGASVTASLSKQLTPSVSGTITSGQPLNDATQPHSYQVTVAYSF